jgi:hypothetical protein
MASRDHKFSLNDEVVLQGRPMRVAGVMRLHGTSGQETVRYLLAETSGSPVIVEAGSGVCSALRPFPPQASPPMKGSAIVVGREKYALVAVRKLKVVAVAGQVPGGTRPGALIVSGVFDGPSGTLMREIMPGTRRQAYYLLKALRAGELLSAAQHAARREAEGLAAARRKAEEE